MRKDFLLPKDHENVKKAARRMESVYESIRDRKSAPPQPRTVEEMERIDVQIYDRIMRSTAMLLELQFLIEKREEGLSSMRQLTKVISD